MKHTLLFIASLAITAQSFAQCETAPCTPAQSYTLPISDVNAFNNLPGSKCIIGNGTMGNNLNLNNAAYFSLNGKINVQLPLNGIPKIFIAGDTCRLQHLHMDGGDTIIITSPLIVENFVCNNSTSGNRNVFVLAQGNTFLMVEGASYCAGSTIQQPGNNSNQADIILCANVPLYVKIFSWEKRGNYIYYNVDKGSDIIELQSASHANADYFMFDRILRTDSGQFKPETGLYRLKIGNVYSSIIDVMSEPKNTSQQPEDNRMFDLSGRVIEYPAAVYIQNHKLKTNVR